MKADLDDMPWEDASILLHQMKIEEEDAIIRIIEADEKQGEI